MEIDLKETTQVHALWFVSWKDCAMFEAGDLLGCLLKQENEKWQMIYRFRYYAKTKDGEYKNGGDFFIPADEKSWYAFEATNERVNPSEMEKAFDAIFAMTLGTHDVTCVEKLLVRGNGMDCLRQMEGKPWTHSRPADQVKHGAN